MDTNQILAGVLQWLTNPQPIIIGGFGCGAIIAAIIDRLKKFGVVKDGSAGWWNFFLSITAVVALLVSQQVGMENEVGETLGLVYALLLVVAAVFSSAAAAKVFHEIMKWIGAEKEAPA
jgi:hypothetical protein